VITLARWCFKHRALTVLAWVVLLVGLAIGSRAAGGASYADAFSLPGTQSTQATDLLKKAAPSQAGDADSIVWKVDSGTVRDPAVVQPVSAMLTKIGTLPHVASVRSPYSTAAGTAQISSRGQIAYATITFDTQANKLPASAVTAVINTAQSARTDQLHVELGGQAIKKVNQKPGGFSELIGIIAAAIVLFLAFGSLLSMLMPLLTAIAGIGVGIELAGVLSHAMNIASLAPTLSGLIGLGVGIDYALFIVTRHRNAIKAGRSPEDAAVGALNTSGRAVLFAGATVCIALLGLLVLGVGFLNGVAIAAALTVVFTVLAAITLLPALLGLLGNRVLSRRERAGLTAGPVDVHAGSRWSRWAGLVENRPRILAGLAVAVMLALAVPALSIRLGSSDSSSDPASSTTRKAYDLLAQGFGPGFNGPLVIVAEHTGAADPQADTTLQSALKSTTGVAKVTKLPLRSGDISVFDVYPRTSPQSKQTSDLISHLRADVLPPIAKATNTTMYVGGSTAIFADFAHVLSGKLPLFILVIITLGALLLMLAFRSLLIPLTAAVMNLIAAAASFGVVVAVFQWGWGSDALGLGHSGPIEAFLPVLMLAILFGLSMDYQVFLVSRMHEEWVHTGDNHRAIRVGQAETGKVITAAATIMICVFLAFIFLGQRTIGEFGIGLATAVALDAFILRTVLVPALMHLFGDSNWWLPGWLAKTLPHLSVDPPDGPAPFGEPGPVPPHDLTRVSA
jgi:RND superfamily putative drug exporter